MAAFEAVGYAKFTGRVGVCAATRAGAIHLLNGLYDAKLDHVPVVAIVGQTERCAMGGSYQQEVDLLSLFKDVCSDYVQMCTVPEQLPNLIDRAIRIALTEHAPTCVIIPSDVFELQYEPPAHAFKQVPSSLGYRSSRPWPPDHGRASGRRPTSSTPARRSRCWSARAPGAACAELTEVADLLGAGRGQGAAGQGRAPDDLPWVTGSIGLLGTTAELQADDGLRHPADRRLELPLHPVPARARSGPGDPDRPVRQVDRHALPLRAQPGRRRQGDPAGADPAAGAQDRPGLAGEDRGRRRRLVADRANAGR